MPTFPQYDSQSNINPNIQAPERHQAAQGFDAVNNMNNTINDLTQKWSDRNDIIQETKAKTNAEMAFAQQEQAALNDPNPDNAEFHIKAINDVVGQATKGIDNQEVAGQTGLDIQHSAFLTQIKIQDAFKKKQVFANDQRLDQLATTTAQNVATAVSPAAAQQDEDAYMATLQTNQSRGLITPERANALVKQYKIGVVKNKIGMNTSTNPDDYKGLTNGLDLQESNTVDKMVKSRIKENEETNIKQTLGNRVDTLKKVAQGELTWRDADQIEKVRKYDPKMADSLQTFFERNVEKKVVDQAIKSSDPNIADKLESKYYTDMVDHFFDNNKKDYSKEDIGNDILKILDAPISKEDALSVLDAVSKKAESLPTTKNSDDKKESPLVQAMNASVNNIKDFAGKDTEKSKDVFSNFFRNMAGGSHPDTARIDAIKTYNVKKYAWIGNLPKEGSVFFDKTTGAKRRIFPDGSAQEEK